MNTRMTYTATAVQLAMRSCFDPQAGFDPARLAWNLDHTEEVLRALAKQTDSRLYVLPEFSFQGWAPNRSVADWCSASVSIPGPETARIGRLARELDAYIAGTLFEAIPEFPGRHFLTGFIVSPAGEVVLRYRKLYAVSAKTRPGDVHRRYLELFGHESLFPVIATPLGRLGMVIAWDAIWPETMRALALRGAEVLLHPLGSPRSAADADTAFGHIPAVRAFENVAFVVSANFGPLDATAVDGPNGRWPSQVCDFEGRCLARAATDDECGVTATLDLAALRAQRRKPIRNFLAHLQSGLHAPDYAAADLWPLSHWEDRPLEHPKELVELEAETWRRMTASGRFEG
jgi:predicted amidohydrolase